MQESQSRKFVAATVAHGSQASEFSKVHWQVGFDSVPGTRIREPCHNCESESSAGDCVVLRMRKVYSMSLLGRSQRDSEPTSWKAILRIESAVRPCNKPETSRVGERCNEG